MRFVRLREINIKRILLIMAAVVIIVSVVFQITLIKDLKTWEKAELESLEKSVNQFLISKESAGESDVVIIPTMISDDTYTYFMEEKERIKRNINEDVRDLNNELMINNIVYLNNRILVILTNNTGSIVTVLAEKMGRSTDVSIYEGKCNFDSSSYRLHEIIQGRLERDIKKLVELDWDEEDAKKNKSIEKIMDKYFIGDTGDTLHKFLKDIKDKMNLREYKVEVELGKTNLENKYKDRAYIRIYTTDNMEAKGVDMLVKVDKNNKIYDLDIL